jgi:hypothetical protein
MPVARKFLPPLILLAVVLAPLLVASLFWGLYRYHTSSAAPAKGMSAAQSISSPSKFQQSAAIDERLSNAERAIMFSVAPLTSLSAMVTPVDPDPVASFRQLIALPPGSTREPPRIDPRRIRTIVDRGVVEYASAKTDGDRARGARLIQTAALVGYPPARDLLVRNYPQSEAVRSVVPAKDVIRYALGPVMDVAATSEDSKETCALPERRNVARACADRCAGASRVPGGNAMSWRKLPAGSGSIGVTIADSDVSGATENMIARSALTNPSSMGRSVCWDFGGEAVD